MDRFGEFKVICLREIPPSKETHDNPETVARYWRENIATAPAYEGCVETFFVVFLSTRRKVIGHKLIATGTLDTILCHPREVFRPAILTNASAIVLMHNHPSGDPTPSEADIKVTRDLIAAGKLLKIEVLDHLVMGTKDETRLRDFVSLRELGYFLI
jgi:DNA repair protein RadC